MIHIETRFPDVHTVEICVDGQIDSTGLEVLEKTCLNFLQQKQRISKHLWLNLEGLTSINRTGIEFLRKLSKKINIRNAPHFLQVYGLNQSD